MTRGDPREFNINLLRVLDAVLRQQSVTRAADALGISQSAVSQSLAQLRQHFDDPLFLRERGGIVATDFLLGLAPRMQELLANIDELLVSPAAFDPGQSERTITICTPDAGEMALLPILVHQISEHAPNCRVRTINIDVMNLDLALEEGQADIVVTGAAIATSQNILQQKVAQHGFSIIAHLSHPSAGRISLEEFRTSDHVAVTPTGYHLNLMEEALGLIAARPRVHVETNHYLAVPHIIAANPGHVAVVPDFLAATYSDLGFVKSLVPDFPLPVADIYHYFHKKSANNPYSLWLRSQLRACHDAQRRETLLRSRQESP